MKAQLPATYSAAQKALAAAVKVEQAKHVHDVASGMEVYAYKAKDGELAGDAAEIKIRATRKIGELIDDEKKTGRLASGREGKRKSLGLPANPSDRPTLAQRDVDKNLAQRARSLFRMTDDRFEREVVTTAKTTFRRRAMLKKRTKTVETIRITVQVQQLRSIDPKGGDHKVRCDGQIVKFALDGYRWQGILPKPAKMNLLQFDKERKARAKAEKAGTLHEATKRNLAQLDLFEQPKRRSGGEQC